MTIKAIVCAGLMLTGATSAVSNPLSRPGGNQTLGLVPGSLDASGIMSNPAVTSVVANCCAKKSLNISLGGGLEYGNVDEIFATIDYLSALIQREGVTPPDSEPPPDFPDEPVNLPTNPTIKDIIDANPEYKDWLENLQGKASFIAAGLAVIGNEAYAKGHLSLDVPVVIRNDFFGGSLSLGFSSVGMSKIYGLLDTFDFDPDYAKSQLEKLESISQDDPAFDLPLSDDITLQVDPSEGRVRVSFNNESLLITKAAKMHSLKLNYSRPLIEWNNGVVYGGVAPVWHRVALSQVTTRFGDITDSEALFYDIKDAAFQSSDRLSLDLGLLWIGARTHFSLAVSDPFKPTFTFPGVEKDKYQKAKTLTIIKREMTYKMEPQLRLAGGYQLYRQPWQFNFQLDANGAKDPMGDWHQWALVSTSYLPKRTYIPSIRFSYRENLTGSELRMLSIGATLFNVFTLDLSSAIDEVTFNGDTYPRSLLISMGVNVAF